MLYTSVKVVFLVVGGEAVTLCHTYYIGSLILDMHEFGFPDVSIKYVMLT